MKESVKEKIDNYCKGTEFPFSVYYSTTVPDVSYKGYKHFLKYDNTHKVAAAFKTLKELGTYLGIDI